MADETTLRRCIGSARFGIEAHEAPVSEFPAQPSQKDGFGRMCKPHWNQYTAGLAREAKARKATEAGETGGVDVVAPVTDSSEAVADEAPKPTRRGKGPSSVDGAEATAG